MADLYYTNSHGTDQAARQAALRQLFELANARNPSVAIVAIHQKNTLDAYESLFGDQVCKDLAKKGKATSNGISIHLHVERMHPRLAFSGPVLVLDADLKFVNKLINDPRATAVIYVPWSEKERAEFQQAHPAAAMIGR